ncbi:hypothetical protein [Zoogloea sp.]
MRAASSDHFLPIPVPQNFQAPPRIALFIQIELTEKIVLAVRFD